MLRGAFIMQQFRKCRDTKLCLSSFCGLEFTEVIQHGEHVFNVKLNQPDTRNSFTLPFWKELHSVFDQLAVNSKCRSIVLSAAGKSFCAGINLQDGLGELLALIKNDNQDISRKSLKLRQLIGLCQNSFTALEKCPKPVIAAIQGHCIGAGISLVAAADIRYASNDAIFSIKEVDVGLAADVGILNRINKLVGNDSLTRELAYTARDFTCSEALAYGFISRQFDSAEECLSAAVALAHKIAEQSPIAVQGSKLTLNYSRDHSVDDSLHFIRTWNQSQLQSEDLLRAIAGARSKRKPEFDDL